MFPLPYGSGSGYTYPLLWLVGLGMWLGEFHPALLICGLPLALPADCGFAGGSRICGGP